MAQLNDLIVTGRASFLNEIKGKIDWTNINNKPSSFTPASHTHGNIQNGGTLTTDVTIANGDKLVVTDNSDNSKIARMSISFDGSTTTQCLTKKGTWETFGTSNLTLGTSSTTALKGDTKYAGASTAGGSATSAVKLDTTTAGSATQPCYFASGKPSSCTYSLNKTVPSNAVFTDANVTQNVLSTPSTNSYKILLSGSADTSAHTEGVYKYSTLEFTPDNNESALDGNTLSMYNNSWETVIRLSCGTAPYLYIKDSSPKYLKTYNTDIVLGDWNGTSNTWDGTNTSLKTAITNKLDKSGGTMTGTIITDISSSNSALVPNTAFQGCIGSEDKPYRSFMGGVFVALNMSQTNTKILRVKQSDITFDNLTSGETIDTWDGTNTSLKDAVGSKATILAETIASLTFSSGVATLAKKTGYILINIYPYDRNDNGYGITSFTEQKNGSYQIRNNTTNLSASLAARAIWLKV